MRCWSLRAIARRAPRSSSWRKAARSLIASPGLLPTDPAIEGANWSPLTSRPRWVWSRRFGNVIRWSWSLAEIEGRHFLSEARWRCWLQGRIFKSGKSGNCSLTMNWRGISDEYCGRWQLLRRPAPAWIGAVGISPLRIDARGSIFCRWGKVRLSSRPRRGTLSPRI